MNLLQRLSVTNRRENMPYLYGAGKYCWYQRGTGQHGFDIAGLLNEVLDRYARRFGIIEGPIVRELQDRLLSKYGCMWQTARALRNTDYPVYPLSERQRRSMLHHTREVARLKIEAAYASPEGPYCKTGTDYHDYMRCELCGTITQYELVTPVKPTITEERTVKASVYLAPEGVKICWHTCKDPRCRAIATLFSPRRFSKKTPEETLINLLMELTKHGDNNPHKRRLAKHFVHNAGQVSSR